MEITNPQIMNQIGEQTVPITEVSIVDFLSVVLTYIPWGAYYAGNISSNNNILQDLLNRNERNAVITGNITKNIGSGNGAIGNITSILGTTDTTIEFPNNSIPEKFTICSITRYTGSSNNKRILTAKNAIPTNDWIHGHKSGKRGVIYYNNEFKTNESPDIKIAGELTDWVITCAKNNGEIPKNIYINGIPSGARSGGRGGFKLAINKIDNANIINELSDFALSYIIIWDTCLSDKALKIISDSLVKYLKTGEHLLFDMSSLSTDDKFKVLNAKSTFLKGEIDETNASLLRIKETNTTSISNAISNIITSSTSNAEQTNAESNNIDDASKRIIAIAANAESKMINLNPNPATTTTSSNTNITTTNIATTNNEKFCNRTSMPNPDTLSFIEPDEKIPITSDNESHGSYIWCKCNNINSQSPDCKKYKVCRDFYADNKNSTYDNISDLNKKIYEDCSVIYKETYPQFLSKVK